MANRRRRRGEDVLLNALAGGAIVEAAAGQVGMSERTVYRRLADPGFRRRLEELRAEMARRTASSLTAAGPKAVEVLLELLDSPSEATRLGAARLILQLGPKLREASDLEARLAAIEARLADRPGH